MARVRGTPNASVVPAWQIEGVIEGFGFAIQRDLSAALQKVMATGASGDQLRGLSKIFDLKKLERERAKAHARVANSMQAAVQVEVDKIKGPSYEPRKNRLSGGLSRAVRQKDFGRGDQYGIKFLNRDAMNREAMHWQRLNFGTGSLQSKAMIAKPKFGDSAHGARQLLDVTIKPIAVGGGGTLKDPVLPEGVFFHGGGSYLPPSSDFSRTGNPFYPTGRKKLGPTASIRPKHFMNAGLQRLEIELPKAYEDLFHRFINSAGTVRGKAVGKA